MLMFAVKNFTTASESVQAIAMNCNGRQLKTDVENIHNGCSV